MSGPDDNLPDDPFLGDLPGDEPVDDRRGRVPDFVRKVAVAGLGALFMTEEGIRSLAGQLKLPKEVLGFLLAQAERTKDEVGRVLSDELRRFLQSDKLRDELSKLLAGMTIEVKAEVRLVPDRSKAGAEDAEGLSPKVVVSELNTRRRGKKDE